MLKKTITYKDLDGGDVTEDFYFHLTKAELAEMEATFPGGLRSHLVSIVAEQDKSQVIGAFKSLISATVGRRGDDGKQFIKTPEITAAFMNSDAYSELVISFFQFPGAGAEFVAGVMPADLVGKIDMAAITAQVQDMDVLAGSVVEASAQKKLEDYTDEELLTMPIEEFRALVDSAKGGNLPKNVLLVAMRRVGN